MRKKTNKFVMTILAVLILLFFLNLTNFGEKMRGKLLNLMSPIVHKTKPFSLNIRNRLLLVFNGGKQLKNYNATQDKVRVLEGRVSELQIKNEELDKLIKIQKLGEEKKFDLIPARIITRVFGYLGLAYVLDRGSRDGIAQNQIVVTEEGILIGKILDAKETYSIFKSATDDTSRFTASVSGKSKIFGEIRGRLGNTMIFDLIPKDAELLKNDIIITAGLENGVPQGLLIGSVAEVSLDPEKPIKTALIAPGANIEQVRVVGVIKNIINE